MNQQHEHLQFVRTDRVTYAVKETVGYIVTKTVNGGAPSSFYMGTAQHVCLCGTREQAEAIAKSLAESHAP